MPTWVCVAECAEVDPATPYADHDANTCVAQCRAGTATPKRLSVD